jgi:hypothetical protein
MKQPNKSLDNRIDSLFTDVKTLFPEHNPIEILEFMVKMAKENPFLIVELKEALDNA